MTIFFKKILEVIDLKVMLLEEQIQEIQQLISNLIKQEITNHLTNLNLSSPYLNKQQTCEYLNISNNTLDSWINKGLPTIRIGKTIRFDKNEIHKWINRLEK